MNARSRSKPSSILADKVRRGVAAIAGRDRAVRRLDPAIKLFAHDVAVGAGRRIVSEVGPTLGIGEGVEANANSDTDHNPEYNSRNRAEFHTIARQYFTGREINERRKGWLLDFGPMRACGKNVGFIYDFALGSPLEYKLTRRATITAKKS